ncbi:hypothetical protein J7M23_12885 [Candidatus Sumerlaeota bacterium]|nr:hypothetical protein [Candidatus Sumerlaeota bacterium]
MPGNVAEILGVWAAVFCTLAIFSFLYRDNPFYKLAEHIFVGVSTGYFLVLAIAQTIEPNFLEPVYRAFKGQDAGGFWRLGAGILGVLFLLRLNKRTAWLSTWPLALMVGFFAALRMTGMAQSDLIGQINGTIIPIYQKGFTFFSWEEPSVFNRFVLIGGVICVLIYFFFSLEQRGIIKTSSNLGIYFLMITFGSSYGYTVMARVSLLIGRVQDLCDFSARKFGYASIICAAVIFGLLFITDILKRTHPPQRT